MALRLLAHIIHSFRRYYNSEPTYSLLRVYTRIILHVLVIIRFRLCILHALYRSDEMSSIEYKRRILSIVGNPAAKLKNESS